MPRPSQLPAPRQALRRRVRLTARHLIPIRPLLLPLTVFAILLAPLHNVARAAEPPDNIAEALNTAAQYCRDSDGQPNTEAVLSTEDINKDGGEDWIADYSKLKCEGSVNPMCGSGGCALEIYFWDGAASWDLVFEDLVRKFSFGKKAGKPLMTVITSGDPCNKPSAETCTYKYLLESDTVVPVE